METYELLQSYWWFLISVLGAALVFLLFVQGGQTMLLGARNDLQRTMMVNSLGRKWELSIHNARGIRRRIFCLFPIVLLYKFWRRLLVMDTYTARFCAASRLI